MKDLIFAPRVAKTLAVPHGDGTAGLAIPIHPMENQSLQHQLGIGQMPGTILFKGFKEFGIEPIRSLAGQGFAGGGGDFSFDVFLCHSLRIVTDGIYNRKTC